MTGKSLEGQVAVVAGATRGAGRGIAVQLGAAGATVYCSGRSAEGHAATPGRPETLEETVALVASAGGKGVLIRCDHTQEDQVRSLFERVQRDDGRLDVLVNDVWGGDAMIDWGGKFWTADPGPVRALMHQAIFSHILTARYGAPMMVGARRGLIVEVTDSELPGYRGHLAYDLVKSSVIRLAYAMAWDLVGTGVSAVALTPGFLRSEAVLEHMGVTEANWRDATAKDPTFEQSETPAFIGRAIAALAADPKVGAKSGQSLFVGDLADEYGFTDLDGRVPRFWRTLEAWLETQMAAGPLDDNARWIAAARYGHTHLTPSYGAFAGRVAEALGMEALPEALRPVKA